MAVGTRAHEHLGAGTQQATDDGVEAKIPLVGVVGRGEEGGHGVVGVEAQRGAPRPPRAPAGCRRRASRSARWSSGSDQPVAAGAVDDQEEDLVAVRGDAARHRDAGLAQIARGRRPWRSSQAPPSAGRPRISARATGARTRQGGVLRRQPDAVAGEQVVVDQPGARGRPVAGDQVVDEGARAWPLLSGASCPGDAYQPAARVPAWQASAKVNCATKVLARVGIRWPSSSAPEVADAARVSERAVVELPVGGEVAGEELPGHQRRILGEAGGSHANPSGLEDVEGRQPIEDGVRAGRPTPTAQT